MSHHSMVYTPDIPLQPYELILMTLGRASRDLHASTLLISILSTSVVALTFFYIHIFPIQLLTLPDPGSSSIG
jgi:hypothetical protein